MSVGKNIIKLRDFQEGFEYHSEEADYHLEQYLRSLEDTETHYEKFRNHSKERDRISYLIKEESDEVS